MIVAQISDLHIKAGGRKAYQRVDTLLALRQAIEHVNQLSPAVELTLITGDLGDFGTAEEYEIIGDALATLSMPIQIIPGNHDRRAPLRDMIARLPNAIVMAHPDYCCSRTVMNDWVFIGLDSSVPKKPHGELAPEQLAWLAEQLAQSDLPHVISFHHPPITVGIDHMDVQNLHNASALAAVLRQYPQVKALVCGHVHRPITGMFSGTPVYIAPAHNHAVTLDLSADAPSTFTLEPAAIRQFRLMEDHLVSHLSFLAQHKQGPYPFFDAAGKLID